MTTRIECQVPGRDVEVQLTLNPGETLALMGPNGSGKSTVLSVLAGLITSESRVVINDRDVADLAPYARGTALLGQEPLLFPHLNVIDNVAFGPRSGGHDRRRATDAARHWLEVVGVPELADRKTTQLSGGQAQRVAIARALAAEPDLLLLDEPMVALDVAVQPAIRQTLRRVLQGRTAVIVTHDPLDALLLADRVVVLERGRVVDEGASNDVLGRPRSAFAARLAGLNLIRGTWQRGAVITDSGSAIHGLLEGSTPPESAEAVAVFRPTAVAIYCDPPHGSPRNTFETEVSEIEHRGELIRVHAGSLAADVTVQAAAELDLVQGQPVTFTVKATEVSLYALLPPPPASPAAH